MPLTMVVTISGSTAVKWKGGGAVGLALTSGLKVKPRGRWSLVVLCSKSSCGAASRDPPAAMTRMYRSR